MLVGERTLRGRGDPYPRTQGPRFVREVNPVTTTPEERPVWCSGLRYYRGVVKVIPIPKDKMIENVEK